MKAVVRYAVVSIVIFFLEVSCTTTKEEIPVPPPVQQVEKQPELSAPEIIPEPAPVQTEADEEFERSTKNLNKKETVSKDEFEKDKGEILQIIDKLSVIMADKNYESWLSYLDPDSITYWSDRENLDRTSEMLPVKGVHLKNLYDYFKFIFIPSRTGRAVSEIRYISKDYVKAVQLNGNKDIIYYYFVKKNGNWLIHLPENES